MASQDFYVTFGSNAGTFAERLKADLAPAKTEIIALGKLLQGLERQAGKSVPAIHGALAEDAARGTAGKGKGSGTATELTKINEAADDFKRGMVELKTELATVVGLMKATAGQQGRIARGEGAYYDPGKKQYVKTAEVQAGQHPQAYPSGSLRVDPQIQRTLASALERERAQSPAATASVRDVSKVQLDQAELDRVVRAVNEVRDELRKQTARPIRGESEGTAPAPPAPTAALEQRKQQATAPAESDDETQRVMALERRLAEMQVKAQRLAGITAQAGEAVDDALKEVSAEVDEAISEAKAELAKLQRATTGISRAEQSERRKAEFQRGPDLPDEEYDRRRRMRQRLDLALDPEAFGASVGRGKGQLGMTDLREMAQQLGDLGFQTPAGSKVRQPQLVENIVSSRQAMLEQYGPEIPAELQTGRRVVADKVSDAVRQILENANISAAEAAEEFAAREAIRQAQQAGHLPKDPTLRATEATGQGATSLAGQRLSGPIGVPSGMVKGGEYNDVFGMLPGLEMLQQRATGRAANLAMQPGYDPFRVNVSEEISGHGEEAVAARQAFRALRQATRELDDLGRDFQTFADAIDQNEKFIQRATGRLERGKERPTDQAKIAEAEANIQRMRGEMGSDRFRGLQEVFEAPEYQAGRREREISRAQYEAQMEDRARREREVYVGDAAGHAVAGTRLAPGTKDTYIRNIPGLMYQGRQDRFGFTDQERDPAQLGQMNKSWQSMQSAMRRERGVGLEVEQGQRPQADLDAARQRVENKATAFLNQMQEIFDISLPLESLTGRAPESAANIEAELRRQEASEAVHAETFRKPGQEAVSAKAPDVGTQAERAAAKEASAELRDLAEEIDRATKAQRRLTELREQISTGRKAGEDVSALVAERGAIKGAEGYVDKNELRALRKSYHQEMAAATGGGGAEVPPSGPRVGPSGPSGPGGGGDGPMVNILREILTAINHIHTTIRTGVRITGTDASPPPVEGPPAVGTQAPAAGAAGATSVTASNEEEESLARAATRRAEADAKASQGTQEATRAQVTLAEEQRRGLVLTRAQVREEMNLSNARRLLSEGAEKEFAELKRLNRAGADNAKIVEQQARAYARMEQEMAGQGVPAAHRKRYAQSLFTEANVRPGGSDKAGDAQGGRVRMTEVEEIARSSQAFQGYSAQVKDISSEMGGYVGPDGPFGAALQGMFGKSGFWARMMNSTGTFIIRNFTAGFVFGITNALQETLRQGIITESTFIRVSDALGQTGRETGNLRTQLQGISADYGVALNDVYETAAGLTGLFESTDEIAGATKVVAQLQAISSGALNAKEAMGVLASITGAYADELEGGVGGLEHVADVLTVVQNVLGTNVEVTSEGVGALSGLSQQLKIDFEDMSVYVGQIAKLTNQTGAAAGEQFSRILGSMQSGRGRAALVQALPDTGMEQLLNTGEYGKALNLMLENWDGLTDAQQRNLGVTIAGQRQARAFAALTSNSTKVLDAATRAHNANGEAQRRAEAIAATLTGRIQRLMTNFQDLAQNLIRTGIVDFVGLLLQVTNATLAVINEMFSKFNDLTDKNPLASFLKHVTVGLLGLIVTLKVAGMAFRGFRASMATLAASEGVAGAGIRGAGLAASGGVAGAGIQGATAGIGLRDPAHGKHAAGVPLVAAVAGGQHVATGGAAAVAGKHAATRTRLLRAEAFALSKAAKGTSLLSKGVTGLASAGLGAQIAIVAATAGLINAYMKQKDAIKQLDEQFDRYDKGRKKTEAQEAAEYVGPDTDALEKFKKGKEGFWGRVKFEYDQVGKLLADPSEIFEKQNWTPGSHSAQLEAWRGVLRDEMQGTLDELDAARWEVLADAMAGRLTPSQPDGGRPATSGFDKVQSEVGVLLEAVGGTVPAATEEQALAYGEQHKKQIEQKRAETERAFEAGEIEPGDAMALLAGYELMLKDLGEEVTAMVLLAQGLEPAKALSSEVIKNITDLRPILANLQGAGIGDIVGEDISQLIVETGAPEGSRAYKVMERMAEGNLSRVQFMRQEHKLIMDAWNNARANLKGAEKSGDPDKIEAAEQQMRDLINQLASHTEDAIGVFIQSAEAIAGAAVMRGNYTGAASALRQAARRVAAKRDRGSETPEMRAQRDVEEMTAVQGAAENKALKKNMPLRRAQAQTQSATEDARLEEQIAYNEYQALLAERDLALKENRRGPGRKAILEAELGWLTSRMASQTTVRDAADAVAQAQAGLAGAYADARGDAVASAQAQAQGAQAALAAAQAAGDAAGILNAQAQLVAANAQIVQSQQDLVQSQYQVSIAIADAAGDSVQSAQLQLGAAQNALSAALQKSGGQETAETNAARAAAISAGAAAQQAVVDLIQSRYAISIAIADAAGHTVQSAQLQAKAAQSALAAALQKSGGRETGETNAARAAAISAGAAARQSLADFIQSRYEVSIAIADAAGRTVRSAQLQLKAAQSALAAALQKSGGRETGETNAARAAAISAGAAARDARLQDQLGTIDFQLEMDRITADGAIAMLQNILRTADLTRQQRRDLLLKIKGLKDDLRSSLTSSGFNIPDQVKLPTAYEVRRSLGVDAYEKNFRNSVKDVSRARSMAIESALGTAAGGGSARGDTPEMVRAMAEVRDAVMANGAQVVNNIEMTNQVLRPQMVEDVARRVVQLINNQTRQGARANSARPKLVH